MVEEGDKGENEEQEGRSRGRADAAHALSSEDPSAITTESYSGPL